MRGILFALIAICVIAIGVPTQADAANQDVNDIILPAAVSNDAAVNTVAASEVAVAVSCQGDTCNVVRRRPLLRAVTRPPVLVAKATVAVARHACCRKQGRRFFARRNCRRLCLRR